MKMRIAVARAVFLLLALVAIPAGAEEWTACQPVEVRVFQSRMHVKCKVPLIDPDAPASDAISYFAYPTNDAAAAERVLSTLLSAQVANRTLAILYTLREHGQLAASIGCQWSNCRLMYAVGFGQ